VALACRRAANSDAPDAEGMGLRVMKLSYAGETKKEAHLSSRVNFQNEMNPLGVAALRMAGSVN
jgi:hypothetical protein